MINISVYLLSAGGYRKNSLDPIINRFDEIEGAKILEWQVPEIFEDFSAPAPSTNMEDHRFVMERIAEKGRTSLVAVDSYVGENSFLRLYNMTADFRETVSERLDLDTDFDLAKLICDGVACGCLVTPEGARKFLSSQPHIN